MVGCALIGIIAYPLQIVKETLKMMVQRPFISSILYYKVSLSELCVIFVMIVFIQKFAELGCSMNLT